MRAFNAKLEERGASCTRRANVLGVSCAAGPASRSRSGAAVAANDVRSTEWRSATAVTPSRWRQHSRLGRRAEAEPHQLHTKVSQPISRQVGFSAMIAGHCHDGNDC
jgi:hypothetical protein